MSATIYYQKISKSHNHLPTWAPSSFIQSIERAFGVFPVELGPDNLATLRGMSAATQGREQESYDAIIEAIGDKNIIRLWAEY